MEVKGQTFVSTYTEGDAVRRLAEAVADGRVKSDFARELVEKWTRYNHLSDAQWAWVHKLVHDRLDHPYDPSERVVDLVPVVDPAPKTDPAPTGELIPEPEGIYTKFKVRVYAAGTMKPLTTMDYFASRAAMDKGWERRVAKYPEAVILSYGLTDEGWMPYQALNAPEGEHTELKARKSSPKPRRDLIRIEVRTWASGCRAEVVSGQLHEDKNGASGDNRAQALANLGCRLNMEGIKGDVEVADV
jgi:hypothetical protein